MASGSYNTMSEYLNKIAADITGALSCSDADVPYLTDLLTNVVGKLREPVDSQAANPNIPGINTGPGLPGAGGPPPGPPPGMPMGPPPGLPSGAGGGGIPMGGGAPPSIPGMAQQGSASPDEVRRLLSAG